MQWMLRAINQLITITITITITLMSNNKSLTNQELLRILVLLHVFRLARRRLPGDPGLVSRKLSECLWKFPCIYRCTYIHIYSFISIYISDFQLWLEWIFRMDINIKFDLKLFLIFCLTVQQIELDRISIVVTLTNIHSFSFSFFHGNVHKAIRQSFAFSIRITNNNNNSVFPLFFHVFFFVTESKSKRHNDENRKNNKESLRNSQYSVSSEIPNEEIKWIWKKMELSLKTKQRETKQKRKRKYQR